jgi:predicted metal-dependent RNase
MQEKHFGDHLVAHSIRDIVQQDYGALSDIQEDIAMTFVDQVDPTFWSM